MKANICYVKKGEIIFSNALGMPDCMMTAVIYSNDKALLFTEAGFKQFSDNLGGSVSGAEKRRRTRVLFLRSVQGKCTGGRMDISGVPDGQLTDGLMRIRYQTEGFELTRIRA